VAISCFNRVLDAFWTHWGEMVVVEGWGGAVFHVRRHSLYAISKKNKKKNKKKQKKTYLVPSRTSAAAAAVTGVSVVVIKHVVVV
jgi:hypothetical protein